MLHIILLFVFPFCFAVGSDDRFLLSDDSACQREATIYREQLQWTSELGHIVKSSPGNTRGAKVTGDNGKVYETEVWYTSGIPVTEYAKKSNFETKALDDIAGSNAGDIPFSFSDLKDGKYLYRGSSTH
ncbi:hypothetical protein X943_000431 [Babesia divergens]|uniref:Uncharacterized protein n=1 Tax=Babesia divergens TaxID=32595 RepID=A0AAD9G6F8_BABDI|nr:hypothetical protein X943_000431 [Babesia divergens]